MRKGFYHVADVAGRHVPRRSSPRPARLFSGGFHSPVVGQTGGPQPEHSSFRLPRFRPPHRSRTFVLSLLPLPQIHDLRPLVDRLPVHSVARPLKNSGELVIRRQPLSLSRIANSQIRPLITHSHEFLRRAAKS